MKKKASLWISGITTVAMLAVAVGSFAAWDTLKGDLSANPLTVTTSSPVVLATPSATTTFTGKLVPTALTSDDIQDTTNRKEAGSEVELGKFTAKIEKEGEFTAADLKTTIGTPVVTVQDQSDQTVTGSNVSYVIKVYDKDGAEVTPDSTDLALTTTEQTYTVKIKATGNADPAIDANNKISVNIALTTSKKTA